MSETGGTRVRLEDFDTMAVPSATRSGRVYHPTDRSGSWVCACEAAQHGITPCTHAKTIIIERQKAKIAFLENLRSWGPVAKTTFEEVLDRFHIMSSYEGNNLCCLALSLAASNGDGLVTPDMLYEAVGGKFEGDPRISGAVFATLRRKGLLASIGFRASERVGNHAKVNQRFQITDLGRKALEDLT